MPLKPSLTARRVLVLILLLAGAYAAPRVAALHGISHTAWFTNADQARHLINLVLRTRAWKPGIQRDSTLLQSEAGAFEAKYRPRWPPGVYLVASPISALLGPLSIWTTQLTNLFFLTILALAVVLLGRSMGSMSTGGWAAALVLLTPPVVASSWYFNLDLGLAAMAVMGLHLLLRTRGFASWPSTLLFAVWSVLGMYVKATYAMYLAVPCLVALVQGLRAPGQRRKAGQRVAAAVGLGLLLYGLLLRENLGLLWMEFYSHLTGAGRDDGVDPRLIPPFTLEWLLSVPMMAIRGYPWPLLLPLLPGLLMAHHPRARIPGRALLVAFFWGAVIMLTLLTHRMDRYLLPVYPLLSLLAVWGIQQLFGKRWRPWLLSGLVILHLATLWVVFQKPTPWIQDPAVAEVRAWMHDQPMPSRHQLDQLRRLEYAQTVDYRPLASALGRALAASRQRGPLGSIILFPEEHALAHVGLQEMVFLLAAEHERGRLLPATELDEETGGTGKGLDYPLYRQVPTLLVVHDPALAARIPGDPRKVIAREEVRITTEDKTHSVRVTLLERQ